MLKILIFTFGLVYSYSLLCEVTDNPKPRLLVLTDIGGDPDDMQSLRRLLLYANEFRIEGIIATATSPHEGKFQINENLILEAINDYDLVRNNLTLNAQGYPMAEDLRRVVYGGQVNIGAEDWVVGEVTPGSEHIIYSVDSSEEPLYIAIWGGSHDLAQALLDVKSSRTEKEVEKFISKLRIYSIADQYKTVSHKGAGEWIKENFPTLRYIEAGPPWMNPFTAVYRGMYQNDSRGGLHPELPLVKPEIEQLNNQEWLEENVFLWGALGAGYPSNVKQNPNTSRNTKGVKEGDTPSWFFILPNGLGDPEHPEWGGWGGRFLHQSGEHYTDAQDDHWSGEMDAALRRKWTVARWREAYQNDFAGRMRWCKLSYSKANHNPVAVVEGDSSRAVLTRIIPRGQNISIDASLSYDPDEDHLSFNWWIYHEPSSTCAILKNRDQSSVDVETSEWPSRGDIHIILEITDDRLPRLCTYRRVILKVLPD